MASLAAHANQTLLNKYCWMARQMRNFNDSNSIIQWSYAMLGVKNLLLQLQETDSHRTLITSKRSHCNRIHRFSVSHPTTLSFSPITTPHRILTPSCTPSLNFAPQDHSPLSIHHPRRLSIQPSPSPDYVQPPPTKKRRTILPPQVECKSFTTLPTSSPNPTTVHQAKTIAHVSSRNPVVEAKIDHQAVPKAKFHTLEFSRMGESSMGEEYTKELANLTRDAEKANMDTLMFLSHNRNKYPLCSWYYY